MGAEIKHSNDSSRAIGLSHVDTHLFFVKPGDQRKAYERDDCGDDTKQHDVAEIFEELLSLHIEATCKHDGRQAEVEKQLVVEFHQFSKFLLSSRLVSVRNSKSNEGNETSLVAKRNISLVLECFEHHVDNEHEEDNEDT